MQLNALLGWLCSIPYAYFVPYAYGTYHMRIRVRYNHTRMVRKIVPQLEMLVKTAHRS